MSSKVIEYEFKNFDNSQAVLTREVQDYKIKEFKDSDIFDPREKDKILKIEREKSIENDFSLSPIVKEYRGHSEQEKIEKERRIKAEVDKQVDLIKKKAFEEGFNEGVEQGKEEVFSQMRKETEEKLMSLQEMINHVLSLREQVITEQKAELSKMIRLLTKWVILRELENDDEYISRLLEKLIHEIQTKNNLLIHVSQKNFEKMPEVLEHLQKKIGELKNVRVEVNLDMESDHGIILESDQSMINGSLEQQLLSLNKLFESVGVYEE